MAIDYSNYSDAMGNYYGGYSGYGGTTDTEEERKRKLLAEQQKQQQIQQQTQQQIQSQVPQVPVAPQVQPQPQTTGRGLSPQQIQAESGGRNFDAQGRPLTSPAGAMFANQVMPATAQNPGFGVRPAQAQTPEEYNRVGNEYMDAMRKRYGGNEQAALAAYNAGPGTVDRNMQGGQLNVAALPRETQNYLNKLQPVDPNQQARQNIAQRVLDPLITTLTGSSTAQAAQPPGSMLSGTTLPPQAQGGQSLLPGMTVPPTNPCPGTPSAAIPGQQQPQMPTQPAPRAQAPQAQPQGQSQFQTPPASEQMGPSTALMSQAGWDQRINDAKDDNQMLSGIAADPNAPVDIKRMAMRQQAMNINLPYQEEKYKAMGQQMIQDGQINQFTKLLGKDESEAGLWFKRIFGSLLGMNDVAKDASNKLGYNSTVQQVTMPDGSLAAVRFNAMGTPMEGILSNGSVMSDRQLTQVAGEGLFLGGKGVDFANTLYKTPDGRVLKSGTVNGRAVMVDAATNQRYTGSLAGLTPVAVGTDVANAAKMALIKIQQQGAGKAAEIIAETNAKFGTNFTADSAGYAQLQQIAGGAAPTSVGGAAGAPVGAPQSVAGGATITTPAQAENINVGNKDITAKASEVIANSGSFLDKLDIIDEGISATKKKNNLGTIGQGVIPGERWLGQNVLGSSDQRNTNAAMNAVKLVSAEGMKVLGSQPTDADRDYLTKDIPTEQWADSDVREWLESRRKFVQRKIDIAKQQLKTGGTSSDVPGSRSERTTGKGTKDDPIKLSL